MRTQLLHKASRADIDIHPNTRTVDGAVDGVCIRAFGRSGYWLVTDQLVHICTNITYTPSLRHIPIHPPSYF